MRPTFPTMRVSNRRVHKRKMAEIFLEVVPRGCQRSSHSLISTRARENSGSCPAGSSIAAAWLLAHVVSLSLPFLRPGLRGCVGAGATERPGFAYRWCAVRAAAAAPVLAACGGVCGAGEGHPRSRAPNSITAPAAAERRRSRRRRCRKAECPLRGCLAVIRLFAFPFSLPCGAEVGCDVVSEQQIDFMMAATWVYMLERHRGGWKGKGQQLRGGNAWTVCGGGLLTRTYRVPTASFWRPR